MSKLKNNKAITLVALIITIIVLLILAMVSINLVMNGGIINKSKSAVDKYSQEEVQEQIKLAYSEWQMGQYTGETQTASAFIQSKLNSIYGAGSVTSVEESNGTFTVSFANGKVYSYNVATGVAAKVKTVADLPDATPGQANTTENTKYTSNNKTAVIPKGYTLDATETSIDNGLVITKDGNEWVWIPVANVTDLYIENTTEIPWTMYETSEDNAVVTRYASKSEILTGQTRTTPGATSDYREPDTLGDIPPYMGGGKTDKLEANYTAAGFSSFNDMATKLKDDYKNMLDSVRKYGGFYVGRYELSSAGTKKSQTVLTNTNWYNLYAACKGIDNTNTSIETRMIWGCQWDQVCKFISTYKEGNETKNRSLTDSTSYGNYKDSTGNAAVVVEEVNKYGSKQVTGYSDYWKANNIYDIAGNCCEWTQEASNTSCRTARGGSSNSNAPNLPVTYRYYFMYPTDTSNLITSRPVLYLK